MNFSQNDRLWEWNSQPRKMHTDARLGALTLFTLIASSRLPYIQYLKSHYVMRRICNTSW